MANEVLMNSKLWVGQYDMTGDMNALAVETSASLPEDTTYGSTSVTRLPGLKSTTFQHEGYWNDGASTDTATDDAFFSAIGVADTIMTIAPQTGAAGEKVFFAKVHAASYSPGGAIGDVLPFSISGEMNGEVYRGKIEYQASATASASSTGRQLGAVTAAQSLYGALHVTSVSGTSPTLDINIESDDNSGFTTATTRGSFTQATAATSEFVTVAGAITDDYWRIDFTIGGTDTPTFAFVVSLAIL